METYEVLAQVRIMWEAESIEEVEEKVAKMLCDFVYEIDSLEVL